MNKFKRLVFNSNPRRLPPLRTKEASIWNDNGVWMVDVGNGPQLFESSVNAHLTPVTVTTTPYTHTLDAEVILVDDQAVGAEVDINLVSAADFPYRTVTVKKLKDSYKINVNPDGAETIDDETTIPITLHKEALSFYSDGSNWHIL